MGRRAMLLGVVMAGATLGASTGGVAAAATPVDRLPACTKSATVGQRALVGTRGNDVLCAGATTNVTLVSLGGDDVLVGSAGRDVLVGGTGDDRLYGMGGDDTLVAGPGSDRLDGGSGDDVLVGSAEARSAVGGPGVDRCFGGAQTSFTQCESINGIGRLSVRSPSQ